MSSNKNKLKSMVMSGAVSMKDEVFKVVMHPFFQGRHYVEAVKKCRFYFLRVLYAACSSFMPQTHETIFRIHKASCSLVMSEDNPRCIPFAICSELSRNRRQNQTPSTKPDLL